MIIDQRRSVTVVEERTERDRIWTLWGLGAGALGSAVITAIPALLVHWQSIRGLAVHDPDPWTYVVLLSAVIQLGMALYAIGVPDWSTSWGVSLSTLGLASLYALVLGMTMFPGRETGLLGWLGLLDDTYRRTAQTWSFLITCILLILAYSFGRFSLQWSSSVSSRGIAAR